MVKIKGKAVYVLRGGARVKLLQQHGNIILLSALSSTTNKVIYYMVCSYPTVNGYLLDYSACIYYSNYSAAYYATRKAAKSGLGALLI